MGKEQLLAEIMKLSPEERSDLIDAAIDSLPPDNIADNNEESVSIHPTKEELREMQRRAKEMRLNPNLGSTIDQIEARFQSRKMGSL